MKAKPLESLAFLLGDWNLDYIIPKSPFSEAKTDRGTGTFKKILDGTYIQFDYRTDSGGAAKGIFVWDESIKLYRYWWFENSGNYQTATCNFINKNTLSMNWHDSILVQTFKKVSQEKVVIHMKYPGKRGGYKVVLEVILNKA